MVTVAKQRLFKAHPLDKATLLFSHLRDRGSLWLPEWQNIPADSLLKVGTMFKGRSKSLFVGTLIALAYTIYIIGYMASTGDAVSSEDSAEAVGTGLAMLLILPHVTLTVVGTLFGVIAFFSKKAGFALTAGIIWAVAAATFILYAAFLIPSIVLGFVGYTAQKKLNAAS